MKEELTIADLRILRSLFYLSRDSNGETSHMKQHNNGQDAPDFLKSDKLINYVNQMLNESGIELPWTFSKEQCQKFWMSLTNDPNSSCNNGPVTYASKSDKIVNFMAEFWSPLVKYGDEILELGCNCGANLNFLLKSGYKHLNGIEINPNAIEQMKKSFNKLAGIVKVNLGSLEQTLPNTKSKSIDVLFTMAVLFHIHPTSNFIFSDMVRIARKYICVIEDESVNCAYIFPRNYRRVFEKLGCTQIKSAELVKDDRYNLGLEYHGYTARLFRVPEQ